VVDAGEGFAELRGVEIRGTAKAVGYVPRRSDPDDVLVVPELLFARKYTDTDRFAADGRHAWLRVIPSSIPSWDFRRNPEPRVRVRSRFQAPDPHLVELSGTHSETVRYRKSKGPRVVE